MNTNQIVRSFQTNQPKSVGAAVATLAESIFGETAIRRTIPGNRTNRTTYDVNKTTVLVPLTSTAKPTKRTMIKLNEALSSLYDANVWVTVSDKLGGARCLDVTFKTTPEFVIEAQ